MNNNIELNENQVAKNDIYSIVKMPRDKRFKNRTGETYGNLKVVNYGGKWGGGKYKTHYWYCKCVCGNYKLVTTPNLTSGNIKSCGCRSSRKENLKGRKFNRLYVLEEVKRNDITTKEVHWKCLCDCGNESIVASYNLKNGHVKSCGCFHKERVAKSKLKDIAGETYGRLTVVERHGGEYPVRWLCECKCGSKAIVIGSKLRSGHTRSCGCLAIEVSISKISGFWKLAGSEHPSYNPEITDEEREKGRFLHRAKLTKWRNEVFDRDDYTCQVCKVRGGNLHAHHLNGYHWCEGERFDIENGSTLCEKCHREFHRTYGYRNNTKEQFEMFLNEQTT